MNSRKLVNMFFNTLWIGGLVGLSTSFIVKWDEYAKVLSPFQFKEFAGVFLFFLGYGLVFTVVAQTGFFAYLFIHRYGANFFKSFWPLVQVLIVLFALFDLVYFTSKEIPVLFKVTMTGIIFIAGGIVGYFKMRQTNVTAFIPAVFVMVVITALELSLVLRAADVSFIILMLAPVLAANAYQVLILHRATAIDEEHEARKQERLKQRLAKLEESGKITSEKRRELEKSGQLNSPIKQVNKQPAKKRKKKRKQRK